MKKSKIKARRSALYLPCSNNRAMEKAQLLDTDAIIFDLEDAVAVNHKEVAREQLQKALSSLDFGYREKIVRINHIDSQWGFDDIKALAKADIDGLCIPKVETIEEVNQVLAILDRELPIWANIETPAGVLNVDNIASHEFMSVLVMGTNDLSKCMRMTNDNCTEAFHYAFGRCIMAARAFDRDVLDGVYNHFKDKEGFEVACQKAKRLGFDGKTLIHPDQIALANQLFSPSNELIEEAKSIVSAWQDKTDDKGIVVVNGRIVEALHVEQAERVLVLASKS